MDIPVTKTLHDKSWCYTDSLKMRSSVNSSIKMDRGKMTEQQLQDILIALLEDIVDGSLDDAYAEELADVKSIHSFEDVGLMTDNKGVVLKCKDGSEFQLTIVSR